MSRTSARATTVLAACPWGPIDLVCFLGEEATGAGSRSGGPRCVWRPPTECSPAVVVLDVTVCRCKHVMVRGPSWMWGPSGAGVIHEGLRYMWEGGHFMKVHFPAGSVKDSSDSGS